MKGYTFYLEYPSKRDKRNKTGNPTVLAVQGKPFANEFRKCYSCLGIAVVDVRNRVLFESCSPSTDYLREKCTRISEAKARIAHPEIFNCGLL